MENQGNELVDPKLNIEVRNEGILLGLHTDLTEIVKFSDVEPAITDAEN